jgi:hypothetical protein
VDAITSLINSIDLAVSIDLLNTGIVSAGQTTSYKLKLSNTDSVYPFNAANLALYSLFPTVLTPVEAGGLVVTDNPNIECFNMGDAALTPHPTWQQYAGNNIIYCAFTATLDIDPGQSVEFSLSFIPATDLPDNLLARTMVFDEYGIDPDSQLINDGADKGDDIFGYNMNSVARSVYRIPPTNPTEQPQDPIKIDSPSSSTSTSNSSLALAETGSSIMALLSLAGVATIGGLGLQLKSKK